MNQNQQNQNERPELHVISAPVLNDVITYLSTKPYNEVVRFMNALGAVVQYNKLIPEEADMIYKNRENQTPQPDIPIEEDNDATD